MTSPGGQSRGAPAFEQIAQEAIADVRGGRQRMPVPWPQDEPDYERARLTKEEQEEADRAKREAALICKLCGAIHVLPNTPACPRLASFELNADGSVRAGTFRTDKWHKGRANLVEDNYEPEDGNDG